MPDRPAAPPLRAVRIAANCPICGKPAADAKYRPFCTKRCADIDLGRWLKEGYRFETEDTPSDEETGDGSGGGGRSPSGRDG